MMSNDNEMRDALDRAQEILAAAGAKEVVILVSDGGRSHSWIHGEGVSLACLVANCMNHEGAGGVIEIGALAHMEDKKNKKNE